jgi:hypothetical protein
MSIWSEWKGNFFWPRGTPEGISEIVDTSRNPPDLALLVNYLQQGHTGASVSTFGVPLLCTVCGAVLEEWSTFQQVDGLWNWPGVMHHYVEFHHVRLPDRLVERIRANEYRVP